MSRQAVGGMVLGLVAAMTTPVVARAQPQAVSVELGMDAQSPGNVALIDFSLRLPDGVSVGKVVGEIVFPRTLLGFDNGRRGLSAEAVEAQLTTTVLEPRGDNGVLQVTVTAKEGQQLPPGTLAELGFKVLEDVKEETKVALGGTASAWTEASPPVAIAKVVVVEGEVEITKTPPIAACFFYMH